MRRLLPLLALLLVTTGPVQAATPGNRVIVSNTLNGTLQFFDASTLTEPQVPLPVKGTSPVRLYIERLGGQSILFSANHGVEGSIGLYDLEGDLVTEMAASPYPTGPGTVGIAAGSMRDGPWGAAMVFATNTTFALGGCSMPTGTLTAYHVGPFGAATTMRPVGSVTLSGPIPYAVAVDPEAGRAYASSNCANALDTIDVSINPVEVADAATVLVPSISKTGTRPTPAGPDAVVFDPSTGLLFVTNITASSVSVFNGTSPTALTTIPMPGARPIDANLANSRSGKRWLVTSNGGNDSIGLVDRSIAASCAAALLASCPAAYVLQVPTGVAGGAPEGIDYDPATNRVFTVNKNIGSPSLSVIQISESPALSGASIAVLPLGALGASAPVPALIAFDVVVQK